MPHPKCDDRPETPQTTGVRAAAAVITDRPASRVTTDAQPGSSIHAAQFVAFYLFDVAESIDLQAIPALIGTQTVAARLSPKSATPPYVQYEKPPLSFDGDVVGVPGID